MHLETALLVTVRNRDNHDENEPYHTSPLDTTIQAGCPSRPARGDCRLAGEEFQRIANPQTIARGEH